MSKKTKQMSTIEYYFDDMRSYKKASAAEVAFFEEIISRKKDLGNANYSIHQALEKALYFINDPEGRPLDVMVQFHVNDPRSKVAQTIYLGTKLCPPQQSSVFQITHFFCLEEDDHLLTKVHLDREFDPAAVEKKPSPHIQMGGRIPKTLTNKVHHWDKDVDKPRIPALPICSALLWQCAFLEYPEAEQIASFLKAQWWNAIVQKAEESVLKPFFEDGFKLINEKSAYSLIRAFYDPVVK